MMKKVSIILIAVFGLGACTHFVLKTRSGTHQSRDQAGIGVLPTNASDINHWMKATYPNRVYDFKTDEKSFLEWKETFGYRELTLQELPADVTFYNHDANRMDGHIINQGVVFKWTQPDGDMSLTVAFDSESQRAYFCDSSR